MKINKNKRITTTPLVKCTLTTKWGFFRNDPNPLGLQKFQTICNSIEGCLIQSPFPPSHDPLFSERRPANPGQVFVSIRFLLPPGVSSSTQKSSHFEEFWHERVLSQMRRGTVSGRAASCTRRACVEEEGVVRFQVKKKKKKRVPGYKN